MVDAIVIQIHVDMSKREDTSLCKSKRGRLKK